MKHHVLAAPVIVLLGAGLIASGCAHSDPFLGPERDVIALRNWMSGEFTSAAQSAADPENYFNVRLVMTPIWTDRADGSWLYVEQAVATAADKPYRVRVYHLTEPALGTFHSEVFTLPGDPLQFADGSGAPKPAIAQLTLEQLVARDGCTIVLRRQSDGSFTGGTIGTGCPSERSGAKYVTSEVSIRLDQIVSWDRGFDEAGKQVWGADKGGYIFKRVR